MHRHACGAVGAPGWNNRPPEAVRRRWKPRSMAHILVIEDDRSLRDLLRVHLGTQGYGIHIAADATDGLRAALEQRPDLILCDLNLPYLDGFELVQAFRGDELTAHIPIVVLTGRVDDDSFARATQLGVRHYITKPVQLDDLISAIRSALEGSSPADDRKLPR
jgi:DNA-binding response OmpR family regulator